MRVLLTGTSRVQANAKRLSNYRTNINYLHDMLVMLGHTVDWRPVAPGEEGLQDRYDIALVGLQAVNGVAGKAHPYGALWAASQLPHITVFGDWQVRPSIYSLKNPKHLWTDAMLSPGAKRTRERALLFHDTIDAQRQRWWDNLDAVIAPLFPWGDHGKFKRIHPMTRLYPLDPTNFAQVLTTPGDDQEKRRAWVCAALADQSNWTRKINPSWPLVRQHGQRNVRGWGRISEDEVVNGLYRTHWGVLAPRQGSMAGTGWWRSRYVYAVQARSIMWADPREVIGLGGPYLHTMQAIEASTDAALRQLADHQRDHLLDKSHGQAVVLDILESALKTESSRTEHIGVA